MSGFLVNKSLLDPTVTQYSGGTASFTLPQSGSTNATEVFVGGVPQVAGVDFNVSGTALTLTTSAPAGANMVCARQYFSDGITGTPASNSVATAAIQNDSVTGGKLNPALVAGDLIYADGTDTINRLAKGSALQTLQMNAGATAPNWVTASAGFTHATEQATTSGTSVTFGSIPSGVSMVLVQFHEISLSGSDSWAVRIGDAGGIETTGYEGTRAGLDNTSIAHNNHDNLFPIHAAGAAEKMSGPMYLTLQDPATNCWVEHHMVRKGDYSVSFGAGRKELSAELTQVQVLMTGSNDMDYGAVNIMYM